MIKVSNAGREPSSGASRPGWSVVRELGVRASVIAVLVAAAASASHGVSRWQHRRAVAATHRQAGWQ